jgi:hypothetical protein
MIEHEMNVGGVQGHRALLWVGDRAVRLSVAITQSITGKRKKSKDNYEDFLKELRAVLVTVLTNDQWSGTGCGQAGRR